VLQLSPKRVELIGNFLALSWGEDEDLTLEAPLLRKNSPSAEQSGETDIFGRVYGGTNKQDYEDVTLLSFHKVGNYGLRLVFSDGHGSGIFSWEYLKNLAHKEED